MLGLEASGGAAAILSKIGATLGVVHCGGEPISATVGDEWAANERS